MLNLSAPDLAQHPPRSPRCTLGGYVHLPRLIDKARAHAAGRLGEYVWNCPLDQRFFAFAGVTAGAFLSAVSDGRGDGQVLEWLNSHQQPRRSPWEVEAWSRWMTGLSPGDVQRHETFAEHIRRLGPARDDIRTYFDRLDLDDYVSFGGRA